MVRVRVRDRVRVRGGVGLRLHEVCAVGGGGDEARDRLEQRLTLVRRGERGQLHLVRARARARVRVRVRVS